MRVFVDTILPCDAELAWSAVQTSALLFEIIHPLLAIGPIQGETLPERWPVCETVHCRLYLFGVIPFGRHTLYFEKIDPQTREIHSKERDRMIRRWDHIISIKPLTPGQCYYSDEIEIGAGLLTPVVWLFANFFYRHRQRRWRAVARRLQQGCG